MKEELPEELPILNLEEVKEKERIVISETLAVEEIISPIQGDDLLPIKANITDALIDKIKETFLPMKVDLSDKESYEKVVEAHKSIKKFKSTGKSLFANGRAELIIKQREWVAAEKDFIQKVEPIEDHLSKERSTYEKAEEKRKIEEKTKKEAALVSRQAAIQSMGAKFVEDKWVLGDEEVGVMELREMSEQTWDDFILPGFKAVFDSNEEVRIAKEKEQEEADKKRKEEQDEIDKKQAELKAAADKLERERKEFEDQKEQQRKEAADKKKAENDLLIAERKLQLPGTLESGGFLVSRNLAIDFKYSLDNLLNDAKDIFDKKVSEWSKKVEAQRKKDEEAAIQKAKDKLAEDKRLADIAEQERIESASDAELWDIFIKGIHRLPLAAMKSPKYRKKMAIAKEKIEEIKIL